MFNFKSLGKAFKEVGIAVAGASITAGFLVLQNPETLVPVVVAFGPFGFIAAPALQFVIKYAFDSYKHRNDPPAE